MLMTPRNKSKGERRIDYKNNDRKCKILLKITNKKTDRQTDSQIGGRLEKWLQKPKSIQLKTSPRLHQSTKLLKTWFHSIVFCVCSCSYSSFLFHSFFSFVSLISFISYRFIRWGRTVENSTPTGFTGFAFWLWSIIDWFFLLWNPPRTTIMEIDKGTL